MKPNEIMYRGKKIVVNADLITKREIPQETVEKIKNLHFLKAATKDVMAHVENTDLLSGLADVIEDIEFQLQDLWGFDRDASRHRWWEVPRCTCPHLDNIDNIGAKDGRWYDESCPVHKIKAQQNYEKQSGYLGELKENWGESVEVVIDQAKCVADNTRDFLSRGFLKLSEKIQKK